MTGANQALRILRIVESDERDDFGRRLVTYAVRDVCVGNLFAETGRELVDGQWLTVTEWKALVPRGVDISHRDVIEDADGHRYRVQTVMPRRGPDGRVRHYSCICVRVDG